MYAISIPKIIPMAGIIGIEVFDRPDLLAILHQTIINYGHFTIFTIAGLDLASVLISHSLSTNTVATTTQNWARIAFCSLPCIASTCLMSFGHYGLPTLDYLLALYVSTYGYIVSGAISQENVHS
jgi:hypothetical protein